MSEFQALHELFPGFVVKGELDAKQFARWRRYDRAIHELTIKLLEEWGKKDASEKR